MNGYMDVYMVAVLLVAKNFYYGAKTKKKKKMKKGKIR